MIGEVVYSKICDDPYEAMCNKYLLQIHDHLVVVSEDALESKFFQVGTVPASLPVALHANSVQINCSVGFLHPIPERDDGDLCAAEGRVWWQAFLQERH